MEWIMIVFWLCAVLVVYHHVGYPLLLKFGGRQARKVANPTRPLDRGFKAEAAD